MTLALRLAQQGRRVTLYEAADHLGGLADVWQLGSIEWDRHYHVTLLSDSCLRELLQELELEDRCVWRETKTGFFTGGRLHSMSNTLEFLRFPPLGLLDKLRLGGTIFLASRLRDGAALESIPVEAWLRRWSGHRTFEQIWLPLLRAKLGDNYRHASAAFIWATIARMYAARRTGMKKEMFGFVLGGYRTVLDALTRKLTSAGVEIRCGRPLRSARPSEAGIDLSCGDDAGTSFDRVVLTIPSPIIADAVPGLTDDEYRRLRGVRYQGIICASLVLPRPLSPYYVTNITDPGVPFTGVIEMTALVDPSHFGGQTLVYLPKYLPTEDPTWLMSNDQYRDACLAALARMHPTFRPDEVLAWRVSRVKHVMAVPTLNYSQHVPRMRTRWPGLFVVNSSQIAHATLNVNETLRLARQALDTVLLAPTPGTPANTSHDSSVGQLVAGSR